MRASDSRFARYAHIIIPPPHTHTSHTEAPCYWRCVRGCGPHLPLTWRWELRCCILALARRACGVDAHAPRPIPIRDPVFASWGFDLHPPGGAELHATLGGPIEWSRLPRFQRVSLTQAHRGPGRPCRTAPVALHAGTVWRELHGARQADVVVASFGLVALPAVLLRRAVAFCVTQDYDEPREQVRHARRVSQER